MGSCKGKLVRKGRSKAAEILGARKALRNRERYGFIGAVNAGGEVIFLPEADRMWHIGPKK